LLRLILSSNIWTGTGREVDGVMVEGASIVWTGRRQELGEPGSDIEVLDVGSAFVCPGLVDAHVHLTETGINLSGCDLRNLTSIPAIQAKLAECKGGGVVIASGYDDTILAEKRFLTAADLDIAISDRPVFVVRRDGHSCVLNSKALAEIKLDPATPGIERDAEGRMTGVFRTKANGQVRAAWHRLISDEEKLAGCVKAAMQVHKRGVTGVHALEGGWFGGDTDVDLLLSRRSEIPLDLTIYHQIMDVAAVACQGLPRIGGCILLDGSFGSRTAALDHPYNDGEGDGFLYIEDERLHGMVWEASARGMQCAVHAIGERAIDQAITIYEKAAGESACRKLRHRIEHFELPRPEHLEKVAGMGIAVCMQPAFEYLWGGAGRMYESRLGPEWRTKTNPFRSVLDAGIRLAFGSDSDITPLDPLLGMSAACNHPTPGQSVKVVEALRAYTMDSALLSRREDEVGILEPGYRSDITVLGQSPLETPSPDIKDLPVLLTVLGGEIVWLADEIKGKMAANKQ
jgi:predicted amidohydrolase YtcJ